MILVDKKKCTACGACLQKCPRGCISMQADENGFIFPSIDTSMCVDCGMCDNVCPIGKERTLPRYQKAYAVVNKNKQELSKATSGGAFGAMAEYVLSHGGIVYGCAYTGHLQATHVRIDSVDGVERLNGSKYVQSNTAWTYRQAEEDLKNEKLVLYSGTPCQISGLKKFLKTDYENLITIDIICHGVPSQAYFDKFIEWFEKKNGIKLDDYNFRSKQNAGWSIAGTCTWTKNGLHSRCKQFYFSNYYYFNFLLGQTYRYSCYNCEYANMKRTGDFTLGDFWGAEGENLPFPTNCGCSLVIANSEKANSMLEKLCIYYKEIPLDTAIKGNEQLKRPIKPYAIRETLLREYRELDADQIQKNFLRRNKKAIIKGKLKYSIPSGIRNLMLKVKYKHLR